jgi:tetratricopeptide (TPR) repeat protein
LQFYSLAIELDNQQSGAFSNRAAIYLRNKQFTKALEDLNEAIRLDPTREIAFHRKGLACFELGEFEAAKKAFERGQELLSSQGEVPPAVEEARKYAMWIRKCEVEIESTCFCHSMALEQGNG